MWTTKGHRIARNHRMIQVARMMHHWRMEVSVRWIALYYDDRDTECSEPASQIAECDSPEQCQMAINEYFARCPENRAHCIRTEIVPEGGNMKKMIVEVFTDDLGKYLVLRSTETGIVIESGTDKVIAKLRELVK